MRNNVLFVTLATIAVVPGSFALMTIEREAATR